MPRVSNFYGIAIYIYYRDHAPPHFHAIYGEFEITVDIATGQRMDGRLPSRAASLVDEWAKLHRDELMADWNRAQAAIPLLPIDPLH